MILVVTPRNADHISPDVMRRLHLAFMRSHIEHAVQFWSPNYVKDQIMFESTNMSNSANPDIKLIILREKIRLDMLPLC